MSVDRGIKTLPQEAGRTPPIQRESLTVRAVQLSDFDEIAALGAEMHAESAYSFLPYDVDKLREAIKLMDRSNSFAGWVAVVDDEIVGTMGGCIEQYFFCDLLFVRDAFLFVKKEHRLSPRIVLSLVREFEDWAQTLPVQEIRLGSSAGYKPEKLQRFYTALGYKWMGTSHTKRV